MFFERIREAYPQLSKSQKLLADYLTEAYREAAFMTASQLAETLNLNEATVIRFAQRLGYKGYPDMMQDIRALIRQEMESPLVKEAVQDPCLRLLHGELHSLERFTSHLSSDLLARVVPWISEAQRIYLLGEGVSWHLAQVFAKTLQYLGFSAECPASDPYSLAVMLSNLTPQSVIISLSAWEASRGIANVLRIARERHIHTVAITCSPIAPCALWAEIALICPTDEDLPFPSITGIAVMVDVLIQMLAKQNAEKVARRQKDLERTLEAINQGHYR